jgi:ribosomal protein S21
MGKLYGRSVLVQDGQVDRALRKLKKKVQASGLMEELQQRAHYIKPTTARKIQAGAARSRWRKKLREQELPKKLY